MSCLSTQNKQGIQSADSIDALNVLTSGLFTVNNIFFVKLNYSTFIRENYNVKDMT